MTWLKSLLLRKSAVSPHWPEVGHRLEPLKRRPAKRKPGGREPAGELSLEAGRPGAVDAEQRASSRLEQQQVRSTTSDGAPPSRRPPQSDTAAKLVHLNESDETPSTSGSGAVASKRAISNTSSRKIKMPLSHGRRKAGPSSRHRTWQVGKRLAERRRGHQDGAPVGRTSGRRRPGATSGPQEGPAPAASKRTRRGAGRGIPVFLVNCFLLISLALLMGAPQERPAVAAAAEQQQQQQQYFEQQPEPSHVVALGADIRLRCLVRNRQGECAWLRNGRIVGNIARKYNYAKGPHDGDCSIQIRNASVALDDGHWQCQVLSAEIDQDALQTRDSQLVVLVAPERPQIKNQVSVATSAARRAAAA